MGVSFKGCFQSEAQVSVKGTGLNTLESELGVVLCLFPFFLPVSSCYECSLCSVGAEVQSEDGQMLSLFHEV